MAYLRIPEDRSTPGALGCGPSCRCAGCHQSAAMSGLGERYVPEEHEEEEAPPPPPSPPQMPPHRAVPGVAHLSGWGRFEQLPPRRRPSPTNGLQLRMPAFTTITGFTRGGASLSAAQLEGVKRAAEFIARSWPGASPVTSVRITGYIDANESQSDLGQQRAIAVRDALVQALGSIRPGLATRLRWIIEDRGLSTVAKVEIYLWIGPTPMPVPPLVRIPSPAEVARRMVPMGPETPEDRIQRILRTLPPPRPPRRSFSEMFWNKVDDSLNSTMSRLGVPQSLRGPIRDAAHAAIERGAESVLNLALDQTGLSNDAKEAIRTSVRAAAKTPIR